MVGTAGTAPHATVTLVGGVVKAATAAGFTTTVRLPLMVLLQIST